MFKDGTHVELDAIYSRIGFEQHCKAPVELGCKLTEQGYIEVDFGGKTSVEGAFAAGDNTTPMRAVSLAASAGNITGAVINMELINDKLNKNDKQNAYKDE